VLARRDRGKGGRPPYDAVLMFKVRKHPRTAARLWRTRVAASGYDGGWLMQPQRLQALG